MCEHADFQGRCVILVPGRYDLARMDLYKQISSVRPADYQAGYNAPQYTAPAPAYQNPPSYRYYQRPNERLYEAPVTSVHAVVGPPEQRCWVERQQVYEDRRPNVVGAIVGGVIGGVLGHQIGGGRARRGTAAGAVGGAAIAERRSRRRIYHRPRRSTLRKRFWQHAASTIGMTYNFRGIEHRVQLNAPPGPRSPSMQTASREGSGVARESSQSGPPGPLCRSLPRLMTC